MGGKSSSSSAQKAEGDIVFNNVDYGGAGQSGAGALKNFNVGRENTLSDNVFNLTDGGSTRAALDAGTAIAGGALGANAVTTKNAFNSNTAIAGGALVANARVTSDAFDTVGKTASEAIQATADLSKFTTGRVFDYAGATNAGVFDISKYSMGGAYDLSRSTLGVYEDLVGRAGDQVTNAQVTSAQASGKALDYVFQSSKTSTERQSENLIKYATYGGVAIISAVALTAMVKTK